MKTLKTLALSAFALAFGNAATAAVGSNLSSFCGNLAAISFEFIETDEGFLLPCEMNSQITYENGDEFVNNPSGLIPVVWVLKDIVKIGNGDQLLDGSIAPASVEIKVQAGAQFRSENASALVITRGSKAFFEGTAEAPIVMSSKDVNYFDSGEWGGLVVQGYGLENDCDGVSFCNVEAEGVSENANVSYYGGNNNADNSGVYNYITIAESGFDVAGSLDPERSGNEINGFTLVGVGSGTQVSNIQIVNGLDDGIEFFGGAVNVRDITIAGISDDSVDWDKGYTGKLENVVVKQINRVQGEILDINGNVVVKEVVLADHVIEASNNPVNDNATPRSNPTIVNMTMTSVGFDEAIKLKEGTSGTIYNLTATLQAPEVGSQKGCIEDAGFVNVTIVSSEPTCQLGSQSIAAPSDPFFTGVAADFSWALPEAVYNELAQ